MITNKCTCERPDDNTCEYCEQQSSIQILEEAAAKYSSISFNRQDLYDGFKEGASWQQEQILQFLYSEITERRPYSSSKMCEEVIKFIEQFKKK
jgi:hypothetical protein